MVICCAIIPVKLAKYRVVIVELTAAGLKQLVFASLGLPTNNSTVATVSYYTDLIFVVVGRAKKYSKSTTTLVKKRRAKTGSRRTSKASNKILKQRLKKMSKKNLRKIKTVLKELEIVEIQRLEEKNKVCKFA